MSRRFITTLLLGSAALCAQAASPTHLYLLDDASDALGSPALTGFGGGFGTAAYGTSGYVNGVQHFSFVDSAGLVEFTGLSQIAYFMRDDDAVSNEASAGFVDYIRIYDVALDASEVAGLSNPVPEPGTWALMLGGLALLGHAARRR